MTNYLELSIATIVMLLYVSVEKAHAFSTIFPSKATTKGQYRSEQRHPSQYPSPQLIVLFADNSDDYEGGVPTTEGSQQQEKQPTPSAPPPVPQFRLDPLMASLTRVDPSSSDVPTKNIPFLGEIPVDGSLALLIPAAGIAVIGVILSIVIAIESSDEIVGLLSQVSDGISQSALSQSNQVYDDSICRGICGLQQQDLEGLRSFMEGLKK
jgi:hypothetical protein